jgi:methionyl aminopeptidase
MAISKKSNREIGFMRTAGLIVAEVLEILMDRIGAGMTTKDLDRIAEREIRARGATPSFKGYRGFPASLCVSINEEIVHGIPGKRVIRDGDLVSLDLGAIYKGFHGDSAVTVGVGRISPDHQLLIAAARDALEAGIREVQPGRRLGDLGAAIQRCAESQGYSVVREYVGHGIGRSLHEEPNVPNYGVPGEGRRLEPGFVLAIEPMLNLGTHETKVLPDKWTVVTADGSYSAHFEHTIALTQDGPEVLTRRVSERQAAAAPALS